MTKPLRKSTVSQGRSAKTGAWPKVLGITKDGVKILQPGKATHFTQSELRRAVESARAAERSAR